MKTETDIRQEMEGRTPQELEDCLSAAILEGDLVRKLKPEEAEKEEYQEILLKEKVLKEMSGKPSPAPPEPQTPVKPEVKEAEKKMRTKKVRTPKAKDVLDELAQALHSPQNETAGSTKPSTVVKKRKKVRAARFPKWVIVAVVVYLLVAFGIVSGTIFFVFKLGILAQSMSKIAVLASLVIVNLLLTKLAKDSEWKNLVVTLSRVIWTVITVFILWLTSTYWLSWTTVLDWKWFATVAGLTILGLVVHFTKKDDKVFGMIKWVVGAAIFLIVAYKIGELAGGGIDAFKAWANRPAPQQVLQAPSKILPKVTLETATEKKDPETVIVLPGEKKRVTVPKKWRFSWDISHDVTLWVNGDRKILYRVDDPNPLYLGQFVDYVDFENTHKTQIVYIKTTLFK